MIVTTFEITTATNTNIKGKIPIFKKRLRLFTFLLVPVLVSSFWIKRAIKTRMPMMANDPARVTVDTVDVVTVEIILESLKINLPYYTDVIPIGQFTWLTKSLGIL